MVTRKWQERKLWRDGEKDPLTDGLATGWLVIFGQRSGPPDSGERTTTAVAVTPSGKSVTVIRG